MVRTPPPPSPRVLDEEDLEDWDKDDLKKELLKLQRNRSSSKTEVPANWRTELKDWDKVVKHICENSGVSDQLEKIMISKNNKISAEKIFKKGNISFRVSGLGSIIGVGLNFYLASRSAVKCISTNSAIQNEMEEFLRLLSADLVKYFDESVIEVLRSAYKRCRKNSEFLVHIASYTSYRNAPT